MNDLKTFMKVFLNGAAKGAKANFVVSFTLMSIAAIISGKQWTLVSDESEEE